jgi:hypothetical protein
LTSGPAPNNRSRVHSADQDHRGVTNDPLHSASDAATDRHFSMAINRHFSMALDTVLDLLITHQTNGIHFNALDRQRLKRARYEGTQQTIPEEVTAA